MRRWFPLVACTMVLSCDGPTAGEVTLALITPNADDGAVAFVVNIPAPNEITGVSAACGGCEVFSTQVTPTELRGIVTGDLSAGPLVRLAVAQAGPHQTYRAEVLAVATRQFADRSPGGYTLSVQP